MPDLFIYGDQPPHPNYTIKSTGVKITSVWGKYQDVSSTITCNNSNNCVVNMNNGCPENGKNEMNWIFVETASASIGQFQYLVNCDPSDFYKPF